MNWNRLFSRAFSLFCLLGFLVQVQQVSQLYFQFQTTSRTLFQIQEINNYQSIMYCPRIFDLIDGKKKKAFGMEPVLTTTFVQYLRYLSNFTVKDILELTPPESEAIDRCMIRLGKMSTPNHLDTLKCKAYFKVTKSVSAERICYTFTPRFETNSLSVGDVATSFTHIGSVYRIVPRSSISNTIFASFLSVDNGDVKEILHSRLFQAKTVNGMTLNRSRILVHGDSIEIKRLPPPFDTACTPDHDREICYEDCLVKKLKVMNRLPWSGYHSEKLNIKMLTPTEFLNETISEYVGQSFEECHFLCKLKTECSTQFSRTTILEYQAKFFYLVSALPSQPHMSVFAIPSLTLIEYIVQMGSCFGMWFGISIISINAIKWKVIPVRNFTTRAMNNCSRRFFRSRVSTQPVE